MINWSKEYANINYCGYCIDITCPCNSSCFTTNSNKEKNRKDHLKRELEKSQKRTNDILNEIHKEKSFPCEGVYDYPGQCGLEQQCICE